MSDPREWWKGRTEVDRVRARRRLDEPVDDDDQLFDHIQTAISARSVLSGFGSSADHERVLKQLIADCELTMQSSVLKLTEYADPASPEARKAHDDARRSRLVLELIESYVRRGDAAEIAINERGQDE